MHEDVEEWKLLSRLISPNTIDISNLQTIGRRDFDRNYNWEENVVNNDIGKDAIEFIKRHHSMGVIVHKNCTTHPSTFSLSKNQCFSFEISMHHSTQDVNVEPLKMIIQGTTSIGRS